MAHGIHQEDIVSVIMAGVEKIVQYHWLRYAVIMAHGITVIEIVPVIVVGVEKIVRNQQLHYAVDMAHGITAMVHQEAVVRVIVAGMEMIAQRWHQTVNMAFLIATIRNVFAIQAGQAKIAMSRKLNIARMVFGMFVPDLVFAVLDIPENIAIGLPNKFK